MRLPGSKEDGLQVLHVTCQRSPQEMGHEPDAEFMLISQRSMASSLEMKSEHLLSCSRWIYYRGRNATTELVPFTESVPLNARVEDKTGRSRTFSSHLRLSKQVDKAFDPWSAVDAGKAATRQD